MQKLNVLLVFVLAAAVLTGCSFGMGADEPGRKWIGLMDKHKKALEEGKLDVAAFKAEATPIAEELKKHRDKEQKKVLLSDEVLTEFKRASNEFEKLLDEKGTPEQRQAYVEILAIWTTDESAPANTQ